MNLSYLSSIRLIMLILVSYSYYSSYVNHTTIQIIFIVFSVLGFSLNHFLLVNFYRKFFHLVIILDSFYILGFVFFFPESTLYLLFFGVNAVTVFLHAENKKELFVYSIAFFIMWGSCVTYAYQMTGIIDVKDNLINFSFIVFEAIVGRLIHRLFHAQKKIKNQYSELERTHHALKQAHEQLHDYSQQLEELTLIRERNRISGEIHDTVGHKMTALLMQIQVAKELLDIQPEKSKQTIFLCEELARNALQEIRLSVRTIMENGENKSFITIIRKMLEDYQEMTELKTSLRMKGDVTQLPTSIQLDVTRIIQESVTNAVRHGNATQCDVLIEVMKSSIEVIIKDNGIGTSNVDPGFGLKNMRERVLAYGGQILFESNMEEGFIVKATFPLGEMTWQLGGAL